MKTQHPQIIPTQSGILDILNINKDIKKSLSKLKKDVIEIVFFGSDPWSIRVLKSLEDNFDVNAVICAADSPVSNYFKGPILTPEKLDSEFITSNLLILNSDLFVVASYGKIIPQELLDIPKYGALNVHPSLLPKYRGASPVPAAILNGDKKTGVTIIKMDEKMDHGPILITKEIGLTGQEDFLTLINFLFQEGAKLLTEVIPDFVSGKLKVKEQNHDKASFCKLLKKEDGYFNINNPPDSEILDRMVRAYYPWPGVWTKWKDKIVKFLPGGLIQMEGKKPMPLKNFLNGYPNFPLKNI